MIRSFINVILPDDEYKRMRMLYFMAEAVGLTILAFLLLGISAYFFNDFLVDAQILFFSPFLIVMYIFFRYIFSGMEHTELFHESDYKKERRHAFTRSLKNGVIFGIAMLIVKGIPKNMNETYDIIFVPVLFIIFYYIFEIISLKRSMKKNIDLDH